MRNVIFRTLFLFPAFACADSLVPQCAGVQPLSTLVLNQSGCVDGNESVSYFWATSIGGPGPDFSADLSPVDLLDVAFPPSTMSEPGVEFTGGFTLDGGNSGAVRYEIISYVLSGGASISGLDLNVGTLSQTGTGGEAFVAGLAFTSNRDRNLTWALPGESSAMTFNNPVSALRIFDVVAIYAPPHDTATLDGFSVLVHAAPEPATLLMLGTALLAFGRIARRIAKGV